MAKPKYARHELFKMDQAQKNLIQTWTDILKLMNKMVKEMENER